MKEFGSIPEPAFVSPKAATSRKPSLLARLFFGDVPLAVSASLRDDGSSWTEGGGAFDRFGRPFKLRHRSGLTLWIANRAFGMTVTPTGGRKWGSVTLLSAFGLSPGHWLLRRSADRWLVKNGYRKSQHVRPRSSIMADLKATEAGE